jgi:hypothetical protein
VFEKRSASTIARRGRSVDHTPSVASDVEVGNAIEVSISRDDRRLVLATYPGDERVAVGDPIPGIEYRCFDECGRPNCGLRYASRTAVPVTPPELRSPLRDTFVSLGRPIP